MMIRIGMLLLFFVTFLLVSCTALNNPYTSRQGMRTNTCAVNLSMPVKLERVNFIPANTWSRLRPCEMVAVSRNFRQDKWGISAALNYTYADVMVNDASMGFSVRGNLNLIGSTPTTIQGWKEREDRKWRSYIEGRGGSETLDWMYEDRDGLACWRRISTTLEKGEQSSLSIAYFCWEPGKENYPPISIGGWIGYWEGKPIHDLNIDKDLIDPIFATLEIKDIDPDFYAQRMEESRIKKKEQCKRRIKFAINHGERLHTNKDIRLLEECGYDTTKLKREEE